jgi:hypothetical protein
MPILSSPANVTHHLVEVKHKPSLVMSVRFHLDRPNGGVVLIAQQLVDLSSGVVRGGILPIQERYTYLASLLA